MELKLKPSPNNQFPLGGFLIRSPHPKVWLNELQELAFQLADIKLYPIPGHEANSIWGCFVSTHLLLNSQMVGRHELCQQVFPNFYIPERSSLIPALSEEDIKLLFPEGKHVFHPDFGLVELPTDFNLESLLAPISEVSQSVKRPAKEVFIPKHINSFKVVPVSPEETLKKLEESTKQEKMPDEPLSLLEKGRLAFLKALFKKKDNQDKDKETEKTGFMQKLEGFVGSFSGNNKESEWSDKLQREYEYLKARNQKQIDKFLDLLKNNPEEALKYAIPLDQNGSSRGASGAEALLNLSKLWNDFSLFDNVNLGSGSGGAANIGDRFDSLRTQYYNTAKKLIEEGKHQKAAFIYIKLLQDYHLAAQTLEDGKLYQEAATVHLMHTKNKQKAAECYEKGNMTEKAIEIYKELNNYEKVGDLYTSLNQASEANTFYQKKADELLASNRHLMASKVYQHKMRNLDKAQTTLLEGWEYQNDGYNCLITYLDNLADSESIQHELDSIYANQVTRSNKEVFMKVIRHEYDRNGDIANHLREMAYSLIAQYVKHDTKLIENLKYFNPEDKEVNKDVFRFKTGKKK